MSVCQRLKSLYLFPRFAFNDLSPTPFLCVCLVYDHAFEFLPTI